MVRRMSLRSTAWLRDHPVRTLAGERRRRPAVRISERRAGYARRRGGGHQCVTRRVRARGVAIEEGQWGYRVLVVQDLDGNQLFFPYPNERGVDPEGLVRT